MRLRFSKMHHLGEDLIVIDGLTQHVRLNADMVRFLSDRKLGVGCQQVLVIEAPSRPDMDFRCRIFNKDGALTSHHHHAACCLARFVWERNLTAKRQLRVEVLKGPNMTLEARPDGKVTLDLGLPCLQPGADGDVGPINQRLDLGDRDCQVTTLNLAQGYAIVVLPSLADAQLEALGHRIQQHPNMPPGINVGFMAVLSRREIDLWLVRPSGSDVGGCPVGATAAIMVGRLQGLLDEEVQVNLPEGRLDMRWQGEGQPVQATTSASMIYQGQIHL